MNYILKQGLWLLATLFLVAACSPQENDKYALGALDTVSVEQVGFTMAPTEKSDNEIVFTNTTNTGFPVSVSWDLGNGATGTTQSITGQYPEKGDYTVTLTVYSADGTSVSKSQVIHLDNDDFSLIDTPVYRNLTGGIENVDGKTWVFDQYNNFAQEVADATGFNIGGHMGLGPLTNDDGSPHYGQGWWSAGPNEKSTWQLYDFKFTFVQQGVRLKIENAGEGYGRNACAASGGFTVTEVSGEDALFAYDGGDYTYGINESGEYPTLELSGNAFMGYYCGSQVYQIIYQTDKVMALRVENTIESQSWMFIFCLEELNVAEPPVIKTPQAIPLSETFETTPFTVNFEKEATGALTQAGYGNPAPVPINSSSDVYLYQKSNEFYSNVFWTAATYKFDLTTHNKIRMKVYIPSYNDYTTENEVAGEWITNSKLLPQLAVKLQDSEQSAPWEGQTEIIKTDLEMNKWLQLEFDFSSVANRKDYDRIVIQFGGEGHSGPGIFFFDDFSFSE